MRPNGLRSFHVASHGDKRDVETSAVSSWRAARAQTIHDSEEETEEGQTDTLLPSEAFPTR